MAFSYQQKRFGTTSAQVVARASGQVVVRLPRSVRDRHQHDCGSTLVVKWLAFNDALSSRDQELW